MSYHLSKSVSLASVLLIYILFSRSIILLAVELKHVLNRESLLQFDLICRSNFKLLYMKDVANLLISLLSYASRVTSYQILLLYRVCHI